MEGLIDEALVFVTVLVVTGLLIVRHLLAQKPRYSAPPASGSASAAVSASPPGGSARSGAGGSGGGSGGSAKGAARRRAFFDSKSGAHITEEQLSKSFGSSPSVVGGGHFSVSPARFVLHGSDDESEDSPARAGFPSLAKAATKATTSASSEFTQGQLTVRLPEARGLVEKALGHANPFCVLTLEEHQAKTATAHETLNPKFQETFTFDVASSSSTLQIYVWHEDFYCKYDNYMGRVCIPLSTLGSTDGFVDQWFPLGPHHDNESGFFGEIHVQMQYVPTAPEKVSGANFQLLRTLGKGSYGKVLQVRKKDTGAIYALKVMRKDVIISRNKCVHVQMEKSVLQSIRHPFIVSLRFSFQTATKLYLVLDYMSGGELFFHLKREHKFTEDVARFYAAELLLALEHLHSFDIIYRDLKPENCLLEHTGHVRLTDFGLCKQIDPKVGTKTFCGTPEYLAPEVILGQEYGLAVDWWCLGVLIYEMLTGLPPFYRKNKNEMYETILHGKLHIPSYVSNDAASLLQHLLQRSPQKRLGGSPLGAKEIKAHPFFQPVDWEKLLLKQVEPPMLPEVDHEHDVKNFDPSITAVAAVDSFVDTRISPATQKLFSGFSYNGSPQLGTVLEDHDLAGVDDDDDDDEDGGA